MLFPLYEEVEGVKRMMFHMNADYKKHYSIANWTGKCFIFLEHLNVLY